MQIAYPFRIDGRGRAAEADDDGHIRDLIEQVLFTQPGERVNRPDFGCGLAQMVFAPSSGELAAAVQLTAQAALQQWLSDRITVEQVAVESLDSTLTVTVRYIITRTHERRTERYVRGA